MGMTYADTGVDYNAMDPFKRACQRRASRTSKNADRFGLKFVEWTRGESVQLVYKVVSDRLHHHFGHVEEGLGTKSLVADAMQNLTGKSYYDQIAQDTVAMIVNDMVTLGVLPITVAMHLAVAESAWFGEIKRADDLINGWGDSCDLARCVWAGGETPTLNGIIVPGTALLSGSSMGMIKGGGDPFNSSEIKHGDRIIFIQSSGIQANGLTMARKIADKLPEGYLTKLSDGRSYGETLLDPTHIYVELVEDCLDAGVDIHYAINVTGHGWRKLMRATQPFTYVIETLPDQLPIFDFLQEHGPVDDKEAYGNFNMGAGFALYVDAADAGKVLDIARGLNLRAFSAGHIENGGKKVVVEPKNITFEAASMQLR